MTENGLQEREAVARSPVSWQRVDVSCTCCSNTTHLHRALLPLWKLWDTCQGRWVQSVAADLCRHSHGLWTTIDTHTHTHANTRPQLTHHSTSTIQL